MNEIKSKDVKNKVAVIGSGLAGLTIANLLSTSDANEVTIFEKSSEVGFDTYTIPIDYYEDGKKKTAPLNTPFRLIAADAYPHVFNMYSHFDVEIDDLASSNAFTGLIYEGGKFSQTGYSGKDKSKHIGCEKFQKPKDQFNVFSAPSRPPRIASLLPSSVYSWLQEAIQRFTIGIEFIKFVSIASSTRQSGLAGDGDLTLGQFLDEYKFSPNPAAVMFDFFSFSFMRGDLKIVSDGVGVVCQKLLKTVDHVKLNAPVFRVTPLTTLALKKEHLTDGLDSNLKWHLVEYGDGKNELFNNVIFATQANQAFEQLSPAQFSLKDSNFDSILNILNQFDYFTMNHYTHRDPALNPIPEGEEKNVNYFVLNLCCLERGHKTFEKCPQLKNNLPIGNPNMAMASWDFSNLLPCFKGKELETTYQTINSLIEPNPKLILSQASLNRVLTTMKSYHAVDQLDTLQGWNGIYFVGSYTYPGIPLLEGCVANSERIASLFGIKAPWFNEKLPNLPTRSRFVEDNTKISEAHEKVTLNQAYYRYHAQHLSINPLNLRAIDLILRQLLYVLMHFLRFLLSWDALHTPFAILAAVLIFIANFSPIYFLLPKYLKFNWKQ